VVVTRRLRGEPGEGFAGFYTAAYPRLLRALAVAAGGREDAEDALQEALARAAARWQRLEQPEAWVRRVALNLITDQHRRTRSRQRAEARLLPRAVVQGPEPTVVAVVDALRRLPAPQREVLALHYLLDLTVEQIALDLRRPTGTVKAQLSRGRARMSALLPLEGSAP
jgi:RNA polymerase sigma-70 factor (ECF subfamily)